MLNTSSLHQFDPAIWKVIEDEKIRQEEHIELIASENYVSPFVLEAQGSILTNKYAEGYPGKRYYGGCEFVDIAESLAIDRVKKLFGADYANVQPHSGSQANVAAYAALIKPGDVVLGMSLPEGGHLTHGSPVNFSGKLYQFFSYGVDSEGYIDYNQVEELAKKHRPKLIVTGFSAYSRIVDWQRMREIADSVGALMMSDIAHVAGLIAAGIYPSPMQIADVTTSTTHKTLRGPRGGVILMKKDFENPFGQKDPKGNIRMMSNLLDMAVFPGTQGGPLEHVIAAKAIAFGEILTDEFGTYAKQVVSNAQAMASAFSKRGYDIVSGGTDNHLMLIDLRNKNISGKKAEQVLGKADITLNKNMVPFDDKSAFVTSGIRVGVPAITTRGMQENHMEFVVELIDRSLVNADNEHELESVAKEVNEFMKQFPLYPELG